MPPVPECCAVCGRKLDGRMIDNPFGSWATPTTEGSTGVTRCGYCHYLNSGWNPRTQLPAGCEALKQLDRWLAVEGK